MKGKKGDLQMFKNLRPVWAEVDLDKMARNMREIRKQARSKDIIAVIKADGYGHGALDIAPVLLENGATRIAVAVITEAIELRKGGIEAPIMILGYTPGTFKEELVKYHIEQTVFTYELAKELSDEAVRINETAKIHISVDTGMGRIGFLPTKENALEVLKISKLPNIEIVGLFTHFAVADEKNKEYTKKQVEKYNYFYNLLVEEGINIPIRHVSNSASIIDLEDIHYDAVRPGIILYGYYPSNEVNMDKIKLEPAMTVKANIVHIKKLPKGESISYGRKFSTERETIVGTIPVGYADGYTRLLFGKGKVIVNGKFAPIIGRICMDQFMVDLTDVGEVKVSDEVILLGSDGKLKYDADDIAEDLGTINYEVICAVSKRIPRVYIKNNEVIKVRNYI